MIRWLGTTVQLEPLLKRESLQLQTLASLALGTVFPRTILSDFLKTQQRRALLDGRLKLGLPGERLPHFREFQLPQPPKGSSQLKPPKVRAVHAQ